MRRDFVTFSSDGNRDYVRLPDGVKYVLGTLSVARLLSSLASKNEVRRVCDAFNEGKEPRITVDLDALQEVLEVNIKRSRWASSLVDPLIRTGNRTLPMEGTVMSANDQAMKDAISQQVGRIEQQIALISSKAKDAGTGGFSKDMMTNEIENLRALITKLRSPSPYGGQSSNSDFYPSPKTATVVKAASFEQFEANQAIVEDTLATVQVAEQKIDTLVAAGKKFNHVAAKADLHKVASRVSDIVASVDLAYGWVRDDLEVLA